MSLLTPPPRSAEVDEFLEWVGRMNESAELLMEASSDRVLNREFEESEVEKIIYRSKNNKAPGLDSLVYEVLKNPVSVRALTVLFDKCLKSSLIPRTWARGIINPIAKSASSDLRVPLNYREISLLPLVSKLYMALLSERIGGIWSQMESWQTSRTVFAQTYPVLTTFLYSIIC